MSIAIDFPAGWTRSEFGASGLKVLAFIEYRWRGENYPKRLDDIAGLRIRTLLSKVIWPNTGEATGTPKGSKLQVDGRGCRRSGLADRRLQHIC